MKWIADWPIIGIDKDGDGKGEPVARYEKPDVGRSYPVAVPQTSDEFDARKLGLQWQWQANYQTGWMSLAARMGWLRLNAEPVSDDARNLWAVPSLLLQKLPAREFTVTTRVDFAKLDVNQKAGLILMGMDYSYVAIERRSFGFLVVRYDCVDAPDGKPETLEAEATFPSGMALLRVKVSSGALCEFSFSPDGKDFFPVGRFQARGGRWIGAKIGLFCSGNGRKTTGHADFDWFRFAS
jgi:beta-xylosidase